MGASALSEDLNHRWVAGAVRRHERMEFLRGWGEGARVDVVVKLLGAVNEGMKPELLPRLGHHESEAVCDQVNCSRVASNVRRLLVDMLRINLIMSSCGMFSKSDDGRCC